MTAGCHPVGAALPPRRDALVTAAAAAEVVEERRDWGMSINVPMARDRMLEFFEREQLPGDVKATLAAALHGDLHYQSLLFTAIIDTWPRLQKAIEEIARKVVTARSAKVITPLVCEFEEAIGKQKVPPVPVDAEWLYRTGTSFRVLKVKTDAATRFAEILLEEAP